MSIIISPPSPHRYKPRRLPPHMTPRWPPIPVSARYWRSCEKIGDFEQSNSFWVPLIQMVLWRIILVCLWLKKCPAQLSIFCPLSTYWTMPVSISLVNVYWCFRTVDRPSSLKDKWANFYFNALEKHQSGSDLCSPSNTWFMSVLFTTAFVFCR